jgi:hypothetical protein
VTAIQHTYLLRTHDGTESAADVIVTGPYDDSAALGRSLATVAAR